MLGAFGTFTSVAEVSKLQALSMIESGDNDAAVGQAGEVSRYQIKPRIWQEYSVSKAYRDSAISTKVAGKHLADLEQTFRARTGREPADFDLYVLWNAGPTYYARVNFSSKRVSPIIRERAQRYANLRNMHKRLAPPSPVMARKTTPPSADLQSLLAPLPPLVTESAQASPVPLIGTTPAPASAPLPLFTTEILAIGGLRAR
jgi:hypothetical protein